MMKLIIIVQFLHCGDSIAIVVKVIMTIVVPVASSKAITLVTAMKLILKLQR